MSYPGLDGRGRLTWAGRLRVLGQSLLLRRRRPPPAIPTVVECPRLPAGPTARTALRWSAESSPPWLHAHVLRTYSWARLLGEASGLQPNDELLFVACILHDLGLTERYAPEPGECFAFAGARHARKLLLAEGLPPAWAARVADAITLHLEVHVSLRQGVEPKLLRDGAAFDVLGIGGRSITREAKRERLRAAARNAPDSRMAFYCRRIDFAGRAARVRLPEEDAR